MVGNTSWHVSKYRGIALTRKNARSALRPLVRCARSADRETPGEGASVKEVKKEKRKMAGPPLINNRTSSGVEEVG